MFDTSSRKQTAQPPSRSTHSFNVRPLDHKCSAENVFWLDGFYGNACFFFPESDLLREDLYRGLRSTYSSAFSIKEKRAGPPGEIARHGTLLSKQGQRREKTSTEEGQRGWPGPPGLSPHPRYLLKLSWFDSGPTGPSFTLCSPLLHTQKQHAAREASCSRGLTNTCILHTHKGGKRSSLATLTCE